MGRLLSSDRAVNSFIMVVYEIKIPEFNQNFLSKTWQSFYFLFADQSELTTLPVGFSCLVWFCSVSVSQFGNTFHQYDNWGLRSFVLGSELSISHVTMLKCHNGLHPPSECEGSTLVNSLAFIFRA